MNVSQPEPKITLSYTLENLRSLLLQICDRENGFSHQQLVYWCDKYTLYHYEYEMDDQKWLDDMLSEDPVRKERAKGYGVAKDVSWKWYFYLLQGTTYKDVVSEDLSHLELPGDLFVKWLTELYS
ncbi:hypothetical protein [Metabacillus iocasae]|uniref:Uncharacterized protein n=1 Tax=Priestia iocasae TaxID=2291674 RepID=A0ABS2QRH3_9BACI|nr:hypothetical protein [Metabacillus iocasae]MBM7702044.1 hypothetical protein [Metabacillus iocasae]